MAMGFARAASGVEPAGFFAGIMMWLMIMTVIALAISILICIGWMKIFTKCGREGWAAFIPIYNLIVMCQITEVPIWYMFVPFVNIFGLWKIAEGFDEKFGKNGSMKIILFLFPYVGYPILGFGKDMPIGAEDDDDEMQMGPMPMGPAPMGPMGPAPMGPAPMGGQPMGPMGPAPMAPPVAPVPPLDPQAPQGPSVPPLNGTPGAGPSVPPLMG